MGKNNQASTIPPVPAEQDFEFDVFISYSHKDEKWVTETLLPRLEQAGLKVCIDFRDFKPGKPSLFNMQSAVRHSRRIVLVMTSHWFASEWTLFESMLSATKDPAGLQPRLIPLLLAKSDMPENADFIAALTYIDFTRADREALAWRQLLTALGKPPEPELPKEPAREEWFLAHPYPMPPNFTGRLAERAMLTGWLDADAAHPLLVLRALGGFGKSALAWHWLTHDVKPTAWPRVVWWSFYEGDASFDHFLAESLDYLSGGKFKPERVSRNEVNALLKLLQELGTLLVLDGFERVLRAFSGLDAAYQGDEAAPADGARLCEPQHRGAVKAREDSKPPATAKPLRVTDPRSWSDRDCISPLAEWFLYNVALQPRLRSKVLLTTRLCPRVLQPRGEFLHGCREEELRQMQPADAVEFFRAQSIRGTHTEIEAACEPYGYHPLSLRLLAGLIVGDFQQPGDIAAAKRLDVSGDLVQRQHHVLETAYDSLTPGRRVLLGRIACFRSPVKYEALQALAETVGTRSTASQTASANDGDAVERVPTSLDSDLRDLVARGLLHHDTKEQRFDLHPIVRRYAYDRLAAPDRAAAHTRLRDYFAAVRKADKVTRLEDLAPVIELYHHTVRAGQFDKALMLFRLRVHDSLYYQLGGYQTYGELLDALCPAGYQGLPCLKRKNAQIWVLAALANSYSLSGQPGRAVPAFERALAIAEEKGNKANAAINLANAAYTKISIGMLRSAELDIRRSLSLCSPAKYWLGSLWCRFLGGLRLPHRSRLRPVWRLFLGKLFAVRGMWAESEVEIASALVAFEPAKSHQAQSVAWAFRALRELFRARSSHSPTAQETVAIVTLGRRAFEHATEDARKMSAAEVDLTRSKWLLGAAHRVAGQFVEAERHLHEALERCRRINMVDHEADILIDLARLCAATGAPDEAQRLAEEALIITERSGYVLQGADAHLELAKLALSFYSPSSALRAPSPPPGEKAGMRGPDWWCGASFPKLVAEATQRASPEQRMLALDHAQQARRLATRDGPPDYTYKAAYDEAGALLKQLGA